MLFTQHPFFTKMKNERVNEIILIIGRRATGKTWFTKLLLQAWKLKRLLVDMFDHPDYSAYGPSLKLEQFTAWNKSKKDARVFGYEFDEILEQLNKNVSNAVICFEDSRRYIEPVIQKGLRKLIIEHRNKNIDLIFQFHNLYDVPPYLASMHNRVILFKTNDNMNKRLDKFSNWDDLAAAHAEVMANKNPFFKKVIRMQ